MTDEEKSEASRRGGLYGFWVLATFAGPLSFAVVYRHHALIIVAVLLVIVHIVCIPIWQRMQKNFLGSTIWARKRGCTPRQLRLFSFWPC